MTKKAGLGLIAVILIAAIVGVLIITNGSEDTESDTAGSTIPTIGIVAPSTAVATLMTFPMSELGYITGETIEYTVAIAVNQEEFESSIQSLVDQEVDVILATSVPTAVVSAELTTTIPIVFMANEEGYMENIQSRINAAEVPNLTGVITTDSTEKRFELLLQLIPSMDVMYVPYDPSMQAAIEAVALLEEVTSQNNIELKTHPFSTEAEAQQALDTIPDDADVIFLGGEAPILSRLEQWTDASMERAIPLSLPLAQLPGGAFPPEILMGYGSGIQEVINQVADLIDQILQGAIPADLPPRPSNIYLSISIGAADAFDIEIPDSILDQATDIVREDVILGGDEATPVLAANFDSLVISPSRHR